MSGDREVRRGVAFLVVGVLVVVVTFGGAWATTPDTASDGAGSESGIPSGDGVLVGVQGPGKGGSVTALAANGSTLWTFADGTGGTPISYQSVERLPDGTVLTSFADDEYDACGPYDSPCKRTGVRVIDPGGDPDLLTEWSYPVRTRKDSEVHDAERLPGGDVLVADMEYEGIFQVDVTTGERTWIWNASEYYDPPPDPTREDWLHVNDVDRIGEGRYLVSVRNTNQLLIIERDQGVVEVVNEDRDPDVLNQQHNPHYLADGRILVADSENDRVVELYRNETTGEWEPRWSVSTVGGLDLDWPRDADRLPNGDTVITDSRNDRVVVVDETGALKQWYRTPPLPYEADVLPHGERPGVASDSPTRDERVPQPSSTGVPVLTPALVGLTHVIAVPYWISEGHLIVTVGVAGLWLLGGWLIVRGRRA